MKLSITRSNLDTCLTRVAGTIPSRSALPILSNVLVETTETGLRMSSTDLDAWIRTEVPAEIQTQGSTTLPGATLRAVVRNLGPSTVEIHVEGDRLHLTCGKASFTLNGMPAADFPNLPKVDFDTPWTIHRSALVELIDRTSYAVSTEDSRPILNGVLWELKNRSMKMVATDGHRLAAYGRTIDITDEVGVDLIVPPLALKSARTLFQGSGTVDVARNENYLAFRMDQTEVYTRLIEGRYPNYRQVIPQTGDHAATIPKKELVTAIARISPITSDANRIRVTFTESRLVAEASSPDLGRAVDEVEIEYAGAEMAIGFNANYLKEALSHMSGDDVLFTFQSPERAVVMRPVEQDDDDSDYLCLVMPLRLLD